MPTISEQIRQLNALAAGLCHDAHIQVEAASGHEWCYDPVRRVIQVSAKDLGQHGPVYCAGILAHEAGHALISRYSLFTLPEPPRVADHGDLTHLALHNLLNAIEDPRVEYWMAQRYPGCRGWFAEVDRATALKPEPLPAGLPDFLRFGAECAREWVLDWQAAPEAFAVPARIAKALAATRTARRCYAEEMLPPTTLDATDLDPTLFATYPQHIWSRLNAPVRIRAWPSRWEQGIQYHAWQAVELAHTAIVPTGLRWLERDVQRLATGLQADRAAGRQARVIRDERDSSAATVLVMTMLAAYPEPGEAPPAGLRLAAEVLYLMLAKQPKADGGWKITPPPPSGGAVAEGPKGHYTAPPPPASADAYEQAHQQVASQIDALTEQVERILQPYRRLHDRAGYPSGYRLDLRRVMGFEADARCYHQLWRRKSIPDRHDTAVFLLVDLSGSMHGPKSEAALLGTVLVVETLHRLGVPLAVAGFQDELIPLLDFADALDAERRAMLASLPLEVSGTRPGGHNRERHNDDGPCLLAAAERLLAQPASDHILVVISDGRPEGRRSNARDLHDAIARLRDEPGLSLIGVGLGPNTDHVTEYYPDAVADVPIPEFAERIGELLERVLVGGMAEAG